MAKTPQNSKVIKNPFIGVLLERRKKDRRLKNLQTATYILQFLKKEVFSFESGDIDVRHATLARKQYFFIRIGGCMVPFAGFSV